MDLKPELQKKLFEITSTLRFNSERQDPIESLLVDFLATPRSLDVKSEVRKVAYKEHAENATYVEEIQRTGIFPASSWFKQLGLLVRDVPTEHVPQYIVSKYLPFADEFEQHYHCRWDSIMRFTMKFGEYLGFKMYQCGFDGSVYQFKSKEEYADIGFVSTPSDFYIEAWTNSTTIDIGELSRLVKPDLGRNELDYVLNLLCFDPQDGPFTNASLVLKPLIRLDKDTVVLLVNNYLMRNLPMVYEAQFSAIKAYRESKGNTFEELVKQTLRALPFKTLAFNLSYGAGFEVDSLLELQKSNWAVEVTSHPPSMKALQGNPVAIEDDLQKSLRKCIDQGKRCLDNMDKYPLDYFGKNGKRKAIMIVVDGVYPQLNPTTGTRFHEERETIYLINWFDLRVIIEQAELDKFEDFLMWRTTPPMPIICYDERDYWAYYFDRHLKTPQMKEAYGISQEKMLRGFYISARFNDKGYIGPDLLRKQ